MDLQFICKVTYFLSVVQYPGVQKFDWFISGEKLMFAESGDLVWNSVKNMKKGKRWLHLISFSELLLLLPLFDFKNKDTIMTPLTTDSTHHCIVSIFVVYLNKVNAGWLNTELY